MLRAVFRLCDRLSFRFGARRDPRGRFARPQFASFMAENNRKPFETDLRDAVLKGRKLMKSLLRIGLALGGAWVVLESARALSVF